MNEYTVAFANRGGLWGEPSYYSLHSEAGAGFNPLVNKLITAEVWTLNTDTSTLEILEDVMLYAMEACLERGSCDGVFHVSLHTGVPTAANELVETGYQREPLRFSNWTVR